MSHSNPIAGLCMHAAFSMARCPSVVAHSKDQACIAFCWVGGRPGSRGMDDRGIVTYECDDWVTIDPLSTSCSLSFSLSFVSPTATLALYKMSLSGSAAEGESAAQLTLSELIARLQQDRRWDAPFRRRQGA